MKYYCKNCGSVLTEGEDTRRSEDYVVYCPMCEDEDYEEVIMEPIHDYETPAQYEKRTGEQYPDNRAVWWRALGYVGKWNIGLYEEFKHTEHDRESKTGVLILVIADPPIPPPADWKPEVTE